MIPLRDLNPTRRRPSVTWVLIALNVGVWLYQFWLNGLEIGVSTPAFEHFVREWGAVPYHLTHGGKLGIYFTPITSMFMHGGWVHLLTNMLFLHVFGDNIEDELGHGRYLLFYLVTGLAAVALQVFIDPGSQTPMVGASGAIAGVLGGYMMLHPRARVLTLVPIVFFIQFVELPAFLFLFVWFGLQLLFGVLSLGAAEGGGVAFFAHIGGFVAGLLLVRLLRLPASERGPIEPELRRAEWRRSY